MAKFIITGATGFIGSHLCKSLLSLGHEVYIIARYNSNLKLLDDIIDDIDVFKHYFNIEDLIGYFCKVKPDCVFNLASFVIDNHTENDIENLIDSNIKFPTQILEAMKHSNTTNIVNTSSYCQHFNTHSYSHSCLFSATKNAFESILTFYSSEYNFKSITLKLFDVYGINNKQDRIIDTLKLCALENKVLHLQTPHQLINITHVYDIVNSYICAYNQLNNLSMKSHKYYSVFNPEFYTLKQIIHLFEEENDIKLDINFSQNKLTLNDIVNIFCNYETLPNFTPNISLKDMLKMT